MHCTHCCAEDGHSAGCNLRELREVKTARAICHGQLLQLSPFCCGHIWHRPTPVQAGIADVDLQYMSVAGVQQCGGLHVSPRPQTPRPLGIAVVQQLVNCLGTGAHAAMLLGGICFWQRSGNDSLQSGQLASRCTLRSISATVA
jgi:hypothetical protein